MEIKILNEIIKNNSGEGLTEEEVQVGLKNVLRDLSTVPRLLQEY